MNLGKLRWRPAYIGIGSNLDSPRKQVTQAIAELNEIENCVVTRASSLYRSAAVGPVDQPDFINAAVAMLTCLSAHELLSKLQRVETDHGRVRQGERWGPRTLDLDLLVFSAQTIDDDDLTVPHSRISERIFVLLPLSELAPHLIVPGQGTVSALLAMIAETHSRIERVSQSSA